MIRIAPGMDQMYMQYLDGQFKKAEDATGQGWIRRSRTKSSGRWTMVVSGTC